MKITKTLTVLFALLLVFTVASVAQDEAVEEKKEEMDGMHKELMKALQTAMITVDNTENGVMITIGHDDPEVVKMLQTMMHEHIEMVKEGKFMMMGHKHMMKSGHGHMKKSKCPKCADGKSEMMEKCPHCSKENMCEGCKAKMMKMHKDHGKAHPEECTCEMCGEKDSKKEMETKEMKEEKEEKEMKTSETHPEACKCDACKG